VGKACIDQGAKVGGFSFRRDAARQTLPGVTRALDDFDGVLAHLYALPPPSVSANKYVAFISLGDAVACK
jgi:hypothetical protein